jgi:hypothetical protein
MENVERVLKAKRVRERENIDFKKKKRNDRIK